MEKSMRKNEIEFVAEIKAKWTFVRRWAGPLSGTRYSHT